MTTNQQPSEGLELKLLDFNTGSLESLSSQGYNQHDLLQKLLETNGRWGAQFRYGWSESSFSADKELMSEGVSASQPRRGSGSLVLYTTNDCRDFYADAHFLEGERVVVVYDVNKLKQTGPRNYRLLDPSGLVAIVRPVMPIPTRQGSSPQARAAR